MDGGQEDGVLSGLLESVVTAATDAILITEAHPIEEADGGPRIVYANDAFARMTGYTQDEVLGRTPRLLQCAETDRDKLRRIRSALRKWERVECDLLNRRKDGRLFWVEVSIAPADAVGDGRYTHWISIQRDVTERRKREERDERALRTTRERLRGAFEHAPIGMAVTRPDGTLLDVNPALARLLGREPGELAGCTLFDITHPESQEDAHEACKTLNARHGTSRLGCRLLHASGRTMDVIVHSSLVLDAEGEPDHIVMHIEDETDRNALEHRLVQRALSDELTGLPNRAMLFDRLGQAVARRNRDGSSLALLFLDVDGFKDINDRLGHAAGDVALVSTAHRLQRCVRPGDTVARFAGDEFVVLCESTDATEAEVIADRLAAVAREPHALSGEELHTSASVGLVVASGFGTVEVESLLHDADAAMYEAKARGGGRYVLFDAELQARDGHRRAVADDLRRALDRHELVLHYQPQIDVRDGSVAGVESLVRWPHAERGLLPPSEFVPIAELSDLIVTLGRWVLREACLHAAAHPETPVVWVNVSARQLRPGLREEVRTVLDATGVAPERLGLELTESVVMRDLVEARRQLAELRELGVRLAIDDFGTGYSSLAYLAQLPVDTVKVDRSFVASLRPGEHGATVIGAILAMAGALRLEVIVEGVETQPQLDGLRGLGVALVQGHLLGSPVPDAPAPTQR